MKDPYPQLLICGGAILAIAAFFLIHPYASELGPVENGLIGNIPIGDLKLPYRYVFVFATILIGYGYYKLKVQGQDRR